ncbi:probable flap endonuclease 1 homolog [Thamnophis elegans]|uniref:probable flap endonuclease 1 homolog n=1 Tax=Thamnophis elegans TaxID=35005 RepID=UPI0013787FAE|nr:probable flap endonuclease 1 homolog [Thamnophis elegans]
MGIVKLAEVIKEEAPDAVRPASLQDYRGRVVAVDASVAVYQFRTAMPQIINRHRENISSLQGLFFRTLHLLQNDLKPLFVIEGKPPGLKLPVSPFGSSLSGSPLEEISLPIVLQKLGMTQEQFVDLCILLGCDYCSKVRGLGPKKALKLLQLHGSIEGVLRNTSRKTYPLPDGWHLQETRRLFLQPEVADPGQVVLEWKEPDEEGLVNFLTHEKHMKESRVRGRLKRWRDARRKLREVQESTSKAFKGRARKAAKTMKDFFPVQKRPKMEPTCPPARKKPKLSATAPGI